MIDRIDRLNLDIDLRLLEIWGFIADLEIQNELLMRAFGEIVRAAYGRGYVDALEEATPALLCREHGYRVPTRRTLG